MINARRNSLNAHRQRSTTRSSQQLGWGSDASCALEAVPIARLMPGVAVEQICADDKSSSSKHTLAKMRFLSLGWKTAGGLLASLYLERSLKKYEILNKLRRPKTIKKNLDWHPQVHPSSSLPRNRPIKRLLFARCPRS